MIKRLLFLILIAVIITLFLRAFIIEGIYVASASMEPTLPLGTNLFVEKITLRFRAPKRGDIIVFPSPMGNGRDLIKRVIGLPADEIEIKKKIVYINGQELVEKYVQYTRKNEILEGDNLPAIIVPEGKLFVLGDNRDESGDSRDWKDASTNEHIYFIPIDTIKGRIVVLY